MNTKTPALQILVQIQVLAYHYFVFIFNLTCKLDFQLNRASPKNNLSITDRLVHNAANRALDSDVVGSEEWPSGVLIHTPAAHEKRISAIRVLIRVMDRNNKEKLDSARSNEHSAAYAETHAKLEASPRLIQPAAEPYLDLPAVPPSASNAPPHPRLRLHLQFKSAYLPDPRNIILYLPPDYDRHTNRHYPVLYLQDGQNLFDGRTSFVPGRTWQVQEHADAAIEAGEVEPLIIVGIYNTGNRRLAEYTPEPDPKLSGGEAVEYGRMLSEELMPWVAANYRILTDRENTGIGGSSLGGLLSLFLGLHLPTHFGKLAVLSPSVWWNRKSILSHLNEQAPQIWDRPNLWLDIGDQEGHKALHDAEQLARRLCANGWKQGSTLHFERIHGGTHDEASWAARVRPMLRFLFPEHPHHHV